MRKIISQTVFTMKMQAAFKTFTLILFGLFLISTISAQVGQIIWEENFSAFNTDHWNKVTGDGCDDVQCGWGNQELEYYLAENVKIEEIPGEAGNYALILEAKNETHENSSFTSGKINTKEKLAIKYGVIEIRIKSPDVATGLWPAAWLLGTNETAVGWPSCGEADMMEMGHKASERARLGHAGVSANNYVGANLIWYDEDACGDDNLSCAASIAFDAYYNKPYVSETALTERFQIYRMYWDDKSIRFTVEDEGIENDLYTDVFPIGSGEDAFQKPFYFLLNLAVGGNFTDAATPAQVTAPLPSKMLIDYIRVRKWNGKGEIYSGDEIMANAGVAIKVAEGEDVSLKGTGSYGPITSYSWTINDAEIATGVNPTVSIATGTHSVILTVTDAEGNTDSDEILVTVGDNELGEIIWEENFDTFNTDLWNITEGDGCDDVQCGWGNQELEYYHPDNVYIEAVEGETGNNALVLEAKNEAFSNSQFTSGKVTTENKVAIKYGVIEVRMKVPDLNAGLWPAAWLLGTNHRSVGWPACGEIDMMEMGQSAEFRAAEGAGGISPNNFVGANLLWYTSGACGDDNQSCAASIAFDKYYTTQYTPSTAMNDRFMIYRMYWDEKSIRLTAVDNGVEHDLYTNPFPIGANETAFQQPYYFLLNLAVGGNFTGLLNPEQITAPMPAKMYVDYVRVRKWNGKGEVAYAGGSSVANAGADIAVTDTDKNGSEEVTLNAKSSYGDIVAFEWYEEGAQIAKDDSTTVTLLNGAHHITLKAIDASGNVSTDEVFVDVQEIVWEDNFDTFNTDFWNMDTGDGCDEEPPLCGWGNQELEYYQAENVFVEEIAEEPGNNALVLEARSENAGDKSFTSGKINSSDKVNLRYGIYEVRMKSPDIVTGLWPAAWMLGANSDEVGWPASGEIDLMEMGHKASERARQGFDGVSANNYVGANLIWYEDAACSGENPGCAASIANDVWYDTPYISAEPLNERFVIYRMYWSDRSIRFTVDDNGVMRDLYTGKFPISGSSAAFREPFYFLLNLAVGGNFTDAATPAQVSAPLPGKMLIDYVRVKKWKGQGEVSYGDGLSPNAGPDAIVLDKDGDGKEIVILDGSGSADFDGSVASYTWTIDDLEVAAEVIPSLELDRGVHIIELTITDNDGNTASDEVVINITSGGLEPSAVAGNDTTVFDDDGDDLVSFLLDASRSVPTDTPIVSWTWEENGSDIASGVNPIVVFSTGLHEVTLFVTDEEGLTGSDIVVITVLDPDNLAPVANAGSDASYDDNDGDDIVTVTLDASGSADADGTIDSYMWYESGIEIGNGETTPVDLSTGVHTITLIVMDDDGVIHPDEVVITIVDPDNLAPATDAGEDMLLVDTDRNDLETYSLDGSGSADTDGQIVSYLWEKEGVEIGTSVSLSIELGIGIHAFTLTCTDDDGISSSDNVVIKVHQDPLADAGADQLVLDADDSGSENVSLDASSSSDPYGSIVSYSWSIQEDVEIGTGVSVTVELPVGTEIVTLQITDDDGAIATDEVKIIVASTDNQSPIAAAGEDIEQIDDDGSDTEIVSVDGSGSSDPDGSIFSYAWLENDMEIGHGAQEDIVIAAGMHEIVLMVVDNEGASATDTLIVNILPACVFEACTGDFKAIISSDDASSTSITFIPLKEGIGESLCYLYYGKPGNAWGVNSVSPYEQYKMSGISNGQEVGFYYTYSLGTGGENNSSGCNDLFTVGDCAALPNEAPRADAGDDIVAIDIDADGSESVRLDGSGSIDTDGSIVSYSWKKGSSIVGTGETPSVTLDLGVHTITLTVSDDLGKTDTDQVVVEVNIADGIEEIAAPIELHIYPSPVKETLHIETKRGNIERIQLYNAAGVKMVDVSRANKLDMSRYAKGIYLLEVTVEGESLVEKIVKM